MKIEKNKEAYIEVYKHNISPELLGLRDSMLEFSVREQLVKQGMFALITTDFVDELAKYLEGKRVLEVMAGAGYLANELYVKGVEIIATDDYSWGITPHNNFPIENLSVHEAIKKYSDVDYILVSWMPMDKGATELIRAVRKHCPNKLILHIGESQGGCTGNDYFFNNVEEVEDPNLELAQRKFERFWGMHDYLDLLCVRGRTT